MVQNSKKKNKAYPSELSKEEQRGANKENKKKQKTKTKTKNKQTECLISKEKIRSISPGVINSTKTKKSNKIL